MEVVKEQYQNCGFAVIKQVPVSVHHYFSGKHIAEHASQLAIFAFLVACQYF